MRRESSSMSSPLEDLLAVVVLQEEEGSMTLTRQVAAPMVCVAPWYRHFVRDN